IASIGSAGGLHIKHVFDTVDLLLDRKSDCLDQGFCVRTWVVGGYLNSWRSNRRILRYRQIVERYSAEQHDHESENIRENGPFDKKSREHGLPNSYPAIIRASLVCARTRIAAPRTSWVRTTRPNR